MARAVSQPPADLKRLAGRLQSHRKKHGKGHRIPEDIWRSAASLARLLGVSAVARTLGLDYYSLKKRSSKNEGREEAASPVTFVELNTPRQFGQAQECRVVLEAASGNKMTLRLPEMSGQDAVELAAAFWRWSQ